MFVCCVTVFQEKRLRKRKTGRHLHESDSVLRDSSPGLLIRGPDRGEGSGVIPPHRQLWGKDEIKSYHGKVYLIYHSSTK